MIKMDKPLFALGKQIQWCWPDSFGEDEAIIILGGLHIEMAMYLTLGTFIEGSGWTAALE